MLRDCFFVFEVRRLSGYVKVYLCLLVHIIINYYAQVPPTNTPHNLNNFSIEQSKNTLKAPKEFIVKQW